jgi:hypothetical protein
LLQRRRKQPREDPFFLEKIVDALRAAQLLLNPFQAWHLNFRPFLLLLVLGHDLSSVSLFYHV